MNFKNLPQLLNYFEKEKTCIEYFEKQRWGDKVVCPHCGYDEKIYRTNRGYKCGNKSCYKKFTVKVGTIFEDSKISLRIWFAAIYLCGNHKKGISSLQLHRDLNISQKTAWFIIHRLRHMLKQEAPTMIKTGIYEADESFIGGKNKNRHADKKVKEAQGRSVKDKTPVLGMVERLGKVQLRVVPDTKATTLKPIIKELVRNGSIVVTDEWKGYTSIKKDFNHVVIKHKDGEYARGAFHTNSIESFWAILKRTIYGTYHNVSPKHLSKYCDESAYRFNSRKITDLERFDKMLTHTQGRLKYNDLIGKIPLSKIDVETGEVSE